MAEAGEDVDDLELHGIPLSLFIIMCSLACLGIVYAVAVLVFNIAKQNDKYGFIVFDFDVNTSH